MLPIVLIPGLCNTAEHFSAQATALWAHGPVQVASTLAGDTLPEIATAILRDAPPHFALAGVSMGGYLSFEILRQASDRVRRLALLDTTARPDTPEGADRRRRAIAGAREGKYAVMMEAVMTNLLAPANRQQPELVACLLRQALRVGPDAFIRHNTAMLDRMDYRPLLPAVRVPTLVLVGAEDPITPPPLAEEMANAIPGARLVIVPNAGHAATIENPSAVSEALVEWLTS